MAPLPDQDVIADRIYSHYASLAQGNRPHLGASEIGGECLRKIWYKFRHALPPQFGGRMLRLFETGHREEARIKENLRAIGVEVFDGGDEFYTFADFGGHFAGSVDGVVVGVPGAEKTAHLLECKTANTKHFAKIKAEGVQKAKPQHYVQMQVYMGQKGLRRALYVVVCKDTDEIYTERVHFSRECFDWAMDRAKSVIDSVEPPAKLSDDPSFWQCKFCDFADVCHGDVLPDVGCRTCAHVTPDTETGEWACGRFNETICPKDTDSEDCSEHMYIPPLVSFAKTTDAGDSWVEYENQHNGQLFRNGPWMGKGCYSSLDLREAHPKSVGDPVVENARHKLLHEDDIPF